MAPKFQTTAPSKFALAGEHAVLRGHPAIVWPYPAYQLRFTAEASEQFDLHMDAPAAMLVELKTKVRDALLSLRFISSLPNIHIRLHNTIPIAMGLGFSAALSVALARWLETVYAPSEGIATLAQTLEHTFHGQSSGMDIAAVLSKTPVVFQQGQVVQTIQPLWEPHFQLNFCAEPSRTQQAVEQVQQWHSAHPQEALAADEAMAQSVKEAALALSLPKVEGLPLLQEALTQANQCFQSWGLIPESMQQLQQQLKQSGAIASKPTGAGGGGAVLSLWD